MNCQRCEGRMFLDRVFTDNKNFEMYCLLCGSRKFIGKETEVGQEIDRLERRRKRQGSLA